MIQQVNLYQQEFRHERSQVNVLVLAGVAFLVLALVASSAYQASVINELEAGLAVSKKELKSLELSYETLKKSAQPRAMDMNLAQQVEKVKRSNEEKTRAKNYLSGEGAGNLTGFSSLLQGLGRQRDTIEELWLKKIKFSAGGFHMRLAGSHYRPELLPEFIQALNDEELYRDREFRQLKISRSEEDKKIMDFVLATTSGEPGADSESNKPDMMLFMARLKRLSEEQAIQ